MLSLQDLVSSGSSLPWRKLSMDSTKKANNKTVRSAPPCTALARLLTAWPVCGAVVLMVVCVREHLTLSCCCLSRHSC